MKIHPINLEACKALREAMGDDVTLIHDAVFSYNRQEALRNGRELEKLNYYWYEAPLPSYDIEGYVELTKKLDIPITVELMGNYLEYIQRGAVDILRSISTFTGGITEMKKLAILSEMYGLKFEPHSYGGIFHQAATLQVILSAKNCEFFEVPIDKDGNEGMYDIGTKDKIRIDRDGYVHAPQKPGLGLEIDWKQVEEGSEIQL
jgi:L-alanine-DL-glutamate epimerase-like enolase superfamily enzyme